MLREWFIFLPQEKRLADLASSLADLERRAMELHAELGTELLAQLSPAERQELSRLGAQLKALQVRCCVLRVPAHLS